MSRRPTNIVTEPHWLFGKLNLDVFPMTTDSIVLVTFIVVAIGATSLLGFITYKRWWGYLWKEWFTTVDHKKIGVGPKNSIFGPQKGHFGQSGPRNGPPGGQTATYRKTEGIQSYLRICGCYDLIKSGLSEPKKKGFYGCSVKKSDFRAIFVPKMGSCSPPGARSAT